MSDADVEMACEAAVEAAAPPVVAPPKIRHDWYQTETEVIITILAKNVEPQKVKVDISVTSLSVTAPLPCGTDYSLKLDLALPVVPSRSSHKISASKIEVKLKKQDGIRWITLEADPNVQAVLHSSADVTPAALVQTAGPPKYPSSSKNAKDWDKVEVDEDDKPEGEAALNALFQKIYADGSDEVKKAMNKSFSESGGTVLSTNWNEVASSKVSVKPPDGQEFKKWE